MKKALLSGLCFLFCINANAVYSDKIHEHHCCNKVSNRVLISVGLLNGFLVLLPLIFASILSPDTVCSKEFFNLFWRWAFIVNTPLVLGIPIVVIANKELEKRQKFA